MKLQYLRPFDGWEGVYLNGELLIEGHSVYVDDLLKLLAEKLGGSYDEFDAFECEEEDSAFSQDADGRDLYNGAVIYDSGCPKEWPFEDDEDEN